MDQIKLDLARRTAAQRGLGNVEFRQLNVRDWDEPGGYDAVYCRVLLHHLSQPVDVLGRMWPAVRPADYTVPGGTIQRAGWSVKRAMVSKSRS